MARLLTKRHRQRETAVSDYALTCKGLEVLITVLREDLRRAEARISVLEEALHNHEQAVPHG